MPCTDPTYFYWHLMPNGSVYSVQVSGPAGFGCYATFDEAGPPGAVQWPHSDITRTTPKQQLLKIPGGTHVVRVYVDIISVVPITVRVEASVTPLGAAAIPYCREITGASGTAEIITHIIQMA